MSPAARTASRLAVALAAALVVAPWRGHVDDVDAQTYQVVVRNMVADGTWFGLRYLPDVWPLFREHLPFSFWPAAATVRLFGERAVPVLYAAVTIAMIWSTGRIAAAIAGEWAGVVAALVLGTCESIWQYGGRLLLEPPLLLFATAAAGAALLARPRWVAASLFAAIAVLLKGPFGVLPLLSVVVGRALAERSPRVALCGGAAAIASIFPAAAFLVLDRALGSGTWWTGYLEHRILGWTTGATQEGLPLRWYPLRVVAGRFWPGLPLVLYGVWRAGRERALRPLAIGCAVAALLLCIPERKWGNHAYVVFPLLAILAGAAGGRFVGVVLSDAWRRRFVGGLAAAAALAWAASLLGFGRLVLQPPCVVSSEFAAELGAVAPGTSVWVVAPGIDWLLIGELAAERGLVPLSVRAFPPTLEARIAIARQGTSVPPSWSPRVTARGWTLLRR
jgi:hypothetical protein